MQPPLPRIHSRIFLSYLKIVPPIQLCSDSFIVFFLQSGRFLGVLGHQFPFYGLDTVGEYRFPLLVHNSKAPTNFCTCELLVSFDQFLFFGSRLASALRSELKELCRCHRPFVTDFRSVPFSVPLLLYLSPFPFQNFLLKSF